MPAKTHHRAVEFLCLFLVGCGTDPSMLLEQESELLWYGDPIIEAAESREDGLETTLYDAEAAKNEACEPIVEAARRRIDAPEPRFPAKVWSDITHTLVLIVPVGKIERCARAQQRYRAELGAACRDLAVTDGDLPCPD